MFGKLIFLVLMLIFILTIFPMKQKVYGYLISGFIFSIMAGIYATGNLFIGNILIVLSTSFYMLSIYFAREFIKFERSYEKFMDALEAIIEKQRKEREENNGNNDRKK